MQDESAQYKPEYSNSYVNGSGPWYVTYGPLILFATIMLIILILILLSNKELIGWVKQEAKSKLPIRIIEHITERTNGIRQVTHDIERCKIEYSDQIEEILEYFKQEAISKNNFDYSFGFKLLDVLAYMIKIEIPPEDREFLIEIIKPKMKAWYNIKKAEQREELERQEAEERRIATSNFSALMNHITTEDDLENSEELQEEELIIPPIPTSSNLKLDIDELELNIMNANIRNRPENRSEIRINLRDLRK